MNLRRTLRAQLRDSRVLLQESRSSLLLFAAVVLGGALAFHLFYTYPGTSEHPPFAVALHATFALIFFETHLPLPEAWYLQLLFYLIPIIGLVVVADGLVRFGSALLNKRARDQKWQVAMASTFKDHVVICGMGKVGYRVVQQLLKFNREVVAIESNPEGRFVETAKALGIPIIIGDARRAANLIKAGVERADAIVPSTDNELANLDIALDARELNPDIKVVMRMYDADLARRIEQGFGIHTAFSTSALAAPIFAAAAMRVNVQHAFYLGDQLLNIAEIVVQPNSYLAGRTVEGLSDTLEFSLICHQRGDTTDMHPDCALHLNPEDKLLVLASLKTLQELQRLSHPPAT